MKLSVAALCVDCDEVFNIEVYGEACPVCLSTSYLRLDSILNKKDGPLHNTGGQQEESAEAGETSTWEKTD